MKFLNRSGLRQEIRFLLDILKPFKWIIIVFIIASILASVFDGVSIGLFIPIVSFWQGGEVSEGIPRLFEKFIDLLQPYEPGVQIVLSVVFVILAVLLKTGLVGFAFKQGLWLSNRANANIRSRILKVLLTVGIDYHHKSRVGELIEKTINHTQMLKDLLINLMELIVFFFMLIILVTLMFILSWQLTLFAFILGSIFMTILSLYLKQLSKHGKRTSETSQELTNAVQENLSAVQLIQSYNKQRHQLNMLKDKIEDHTQADFRVSSRLYWVQPMTEGLGVIAIGVLLIVAFLFLPDGNQLNLAQLLPFLYILLRSIQTLRLLNSVRGQITARWPYLTLVYDLVREDNKPFIPDGDAFCSGMKKKIAFHNVSFSYEQEKDVLKDISLSIPYGKTTAIVGESGVGKSTIVNLLFRFYDPQKGVIRLDEQPLTDFRLASYRRKIGVVSQETFIFNNSVRFNIAFALNEEVSEKQIMEAAKKAGAHGFIQELPEKYNTILGDRGVKLSGGQRQRISIARAILKAPEILILDEATSSLDTITEQKIHNTLNEVGRNRTVLIIAHRLSTVQNADQIIVLKDGRVAEVGTPENLLKRRGDYYALMKAQSRKPDDH